MNWILPIGAQPEASGTRFRVWAANAERVEVALYTGEQISVVHTLKPEGDGYFSAQIPEFGVGTRYAFRVDGSDPRPDPASRFQPLGVHGPSEVVAPTFNWTDEHWRGLPLEDLVIYELHIGTFTREGTFDAAIERLNDLKALGVTAIEIMPVADFPGERNWGYDGVNLFAPSRAYGGPADLKRLIDAAHATGLAVLLDIVYNHLGPEGNYLRVYSDAYFTERHHTPWGAALNFDGEHSRPVRDFFISNALYWAHEYHIDGFRMDATHAMIDDSEPHILAEIVAQVHQSLGPERHFVFIAENEHNDPTLVRGREQRTTGESSSGYGLDGIWADDFHHQVRVALAGDRDGYYADYNGTPEEIATTMRQGWFYTGQESPHLKRPRGHPADDVPPPHFIYCIQNHDQVGNRALGERLNHEIGLDTYRAASVLLLLAPHTPLLWMGQEWAASTPFLFFTDHPEELGQLVTKGRRAEFAAFTAFSGTEIPDPQAATTFNGSKLRWEERDQAPHQGIHQLYRDLLTLRREQPALRQRTHDAFTVTPVGETALALRRSGPNPADTLLVVVNLGEPLRLSLLDRAETAPPTGYNWVPLLDSEQETYGGRGPARITGSLLELECPGAVVLGT